MAGIGDRYIIEIGGVYSGWGSCEEELADDLKQQSLYRIKGFRTLIFDDEGLKKLKKIQGNTANTGRWEMTSTDQAVNRNLYRCSVCKGLNMGKESLYYHQSTFCPDCGAFMEE